MGALSGCVQVLGLDEPKTAPSVEDRDEDGVTDSRDNCPDVANADQLDGDGDRRGDACDQCPTKRNKGDRDQDGLDDACDSCLLGPEVDDDGDGIMDACDLCPATAIVVQRDEDGDLVGDQCDAPFDQLDNGSIRVLFDPLTSIDPSWSGGGAWTALADHAGITPAGAMAELSHALGGGPESASVQIEVPDSAMVVVSLEEPEQACELACVAGQCTLTARDNGASQSAPFPVGFRRGTLRATFQPTRFAVGSWECNLYQDGALLTAVSQELFTSRALDVVIRASSGTKVLGVDLVNN